MATNTVIEIAEYKLKTGVSEDIFLQDSIDAQKSFLDKQPGYLKRQLLKNNDEWIEIVYWDTMINAKNAEKEVIKNIQNVPMFQKIDTETFSITFVEHIQQF